MIYEPSNHSKVKVAKLDLDFSYERKKAKLRIIRLKPKPQKQKDNEEKPSYTIQYFGEPSGNLVNTSKKVFMAPPDLFNLRKFL